jgi:hypothetical protein
MLLPRVPVGRASRTSGKGAPALLGAVVASATLALAATSATHVARAAEAGGGAGEAGEASTAVPAHWVEKKFRFVYQGFTTRYSCQGLREKVRDVLLQLGARPSDLSVRQIGCTTGFSQPDPFPSVGGTFYVLEPASGSTEQPVDAAWQRVNVRVGRPGLDTAGQCELVEQVKQRILPLFSTRNVAFQQRCIPHKLTPNGSSLSVDVLKPAPSR